MQYQVDFGNLMVGIATAGVAIVTLLIARSNSGLQKKQAIANFRMQWISELRSSVTELVRIHYELSILKKDRNKAQDAKTKAALRAKIRPLYYASSQQKAKIRLLLKKNSDDPDEVRLENLLGLPANPDLEEAISHRQEIIETTRTILKKEWERVKSEVNA